MAKEQGNGKAKWACLILTIAVLLSGLVTTWALYGENIKDNTEDIAKLDASGCNPAQKLQLRTTVLEYRMDEFGKEQRTIKANTEEILKRLPK